jgi:hypothetical protein
MSPYIERASLWHDFHKRWIPLVADLIGAQVLPRYYVQIDEHMYIHDLVGEERRFIGRSDIVVPLGTSAAAAATSGVLLQAPAEVGVPEVEIEAEAFLEIRDRTGHELISVVKLLRGPSPKWGHAAAL